MHTQLPRIRAREFGPTRLARRAAAAVLVAALATACSSPGGGFVPSTAPEEKLGLGLVTENSAFEREWLEAGVDLARYDRVLIVPLELLYTDQFQRNHRFDSNVEGRYWPTKPRLERQRAADLERMRRMFRTAMSEAFESDGRIEIATEPGPGVLSLSIAVVDLDLERSRRELNRSDLTAFDLPQTITLVASIRDGATSERLGVMLQPQWDFGTIYKSGSGSALWGNIRFAFDHWTENFHNLLDTARTRQASASR